MTACNANACVYVYMCVGLRTAGIVADGNGPRHHVVLAGGRPVCARRRHRVRTEECVGRSRDQCMSDARDANPVRSNACNERHSPGRPRTRCSPFIDQAQTYTAESERATVRNTLYRSVQHVLLGAIDFVLESAATPANAATSTSADSRQRLMRELTVVGPASSQIPVNRLLTCGSHPFDTPSYDAFPVAFRSSISCLLFCKRRSPTLAASARTFVSLTSANVRTSCSRNIAAWRTGCSFTRCVTTTKIKHTFLGGSPSCSCRFDSLA